MTTKSISSTQAQNNFGRVLDDVNHNQTRYVIERRGVPQAIILSLSDFSSVLIDEKERQRVSTMVAEIRPRYHLGQVLNPSADSEE